MLGAAEWLNSAEESDIANVIWRYGEERRSRRIAKAIVAARPLHTTQQLAEVVAKSVPCRVAMPSQPNIRRPKLFKRCEFSSTMSCKNCKQGVQGAFDSLAVGGRLAVISFHSLEDRQVKQAFKALIAPPALPRRLPVQDAQTVVRGRLVSGPIRAGQRELDANPRARSATLRVIERVVEPCRPRQSA